MNRWSGLWVISALLVGCINYHGIQPQQHQASPAQFHTQRSIPQQHGRWPTTAWAKQFRDPQLVQLIKEALAHNPDLQAASARIAAARALTEGKVSNFWPAVNWEGEGTGGGVSAHPRLPQPYNLSWFGEGAFLFSLSYTLDFWGKNAALFQQALAQEQASEASAQEARLSIATAVASNYNQLAADYALLKVLKRTYAQRSLLERIRGLRLAVGLDSKIERDQSRNSAATANKDIVAMQGEIALLRQQLATLLGAGPDRGLSIRRPRLQAIATPKLPPHLPLNLLGRRPDIVQARWQIEAALQGAYSVQAKFYPNVNLIGGLAFLSLGGFSNFVQNVNTEFLGPAVSLPIFDAGALRAELRGQYAQFDQAVANYNSILNSALADVANQLTSIQTLDEQLRVQQSALSSAKHAYRLAQARYRSGLVAQDSVLNAETQWLLEQQIRLQLITSRRNRQIALVKALGGGFDEQRLPKCAVTALIGSGLTGGV